MSICYLHLGMPKTGSTAIQSSFRHYEDDSLIYAETGTPQHELAFKACFSKKPLKTTNLRERLGKGSKIAEVAEKARRDIDAAAASGKNVIFSGEAIPGQLQPDEMAAMFAYLRERFERVVVIAYVRPAASLVSSQFQQQVKQGRREFALPLPRYRSFFEPIVANVPPADLCLVRFHRDDLTNGDIVSDFASRVGAERIPEQVAAENESFSAEAVGVMFAFNRFSAPFFGMTGRRQLQKKLRNALATKGGRKFGFSQDLVESYLNENAEDIAWMEAVTGFDVRGTFQPVPEPVGSEAELLALGAALAGREKPAQDSILAGKAGQKRGAVKKGKAGTPVIGAGPRAFKQGGKGAKRAVNKNNAAGEDALAPGRKAGVGKGKGGNKGGAPKRKAADAVGSEL